MGEWIVQTRSSTCTNQMPLPFYVRLAKGLDMHKLISEIENIVYSGTKVNIDYYLDNILEIEQQDEIYDYFIDDAETDSIEEAMEEFEEEYDEEELRLMRIKFLSEFAN